MDQKLAQLLSSNSQSEAHTNDAGNNWATLIAILERLHPMTRDKDKVASPSDGHQSNLMKESPSSWNYPEPFQLILADSGVVLSQAQEQTKHDV